MKELSKIVIIILYAIFFMFIGFRIKEENCSKRFRELVKERNDEYNSSDMFYIVWGEKLNK